MRGRDAREDIRLVPLEPAELIGSRQFALGHLGQRQGEPRVLPPHRPRFVALGQPLLPELPDRLQHPEPRLAAHLLLPDQALLPERSEEIENGSGQRPVVSG